MSSLLESLGLEGPVLTDGAWGTALQRAGLGLGECPDLWNLSSPEKVEAVARAYVEAGSRVILTNTFGSSRPALERHGLADLAVELNRAGAELSRRAAGGRALVFASMGPSGKMLVTGDTSEAELRSAFEEQAAGLASGGADAIVVETMSDPVEAALAVRAARTTGLPVVACMVYDSGKSLDRTMMGTTPEQATEALVDAGAAAIGANCGKGIDGFLPICKRLRAVTDLPLWIKANAGLPQLVGGEARYDCSPGEFAEGALVLADAGATFIGGCCGTEPSHIRELSSRLAERSP